MSRQLNNYALLAHLDELLQPNKFDDYCPNGLQVEGVDNISKIITGVSVSQQLIDVAIAECAQAIIVHHGLLWNKEQLTITGIKQQRLARLLNNGINLFAYHLPLDNHPQLGNNVQLAELLGMKVHGSTAEQNLLWYGELDKAISFNKFIELVNNKLGHQVNYFCGSADAKHKIKTIAWCTGGGQNFFNAAINLGVDVYITGDNYEPAMALACESGVDYLAAGHYATERYGIQALTIYINEQLRIQSKYVEIYNPA